MLSSVGQTSSIVRFISPGLPGTKKAPRMQDFQCSNQKVPGNLGQVGHIGSKNEMK